MANMLRLVLTVSRLLAVFASPKPTADQQPLNELDNPTQNVISTPFFAQLERLSRLVDIAYCVGTTGLSRPFSCASRCKDFPTLNLVTTWNTGVLMSDSCGYIAVDHGHRTPANLASNEEKQGAIIVAFRGTYSITNTVIDLSTVPQEYIPYPSPDEPEDPNGTPPPEHKCDNCTVHMGFMASWTIARKSVLPTLKPLRIQYPDYPIYLVGHSLGGAVAALASLEMKVSLGWDDVIVTTFGEPRIGNKGLAKYLDEAFSLDEDHKVEEWIYRRLTHVDDPVPLLPLSEWGYQSHAGEIYISKPDLSPSPPDISPCVGRHDPNCIEGAEGEQLDLTALQIQGRETDQEVEDLTKRWGFPARLKLWQLFFAHRDYFWRLGLCVPGGDPIDWGRQYPNISFSDEL